MKISTRLMLLSTMLFVCLGGAKANRYLVYNNGTAGDIDYAKQAICNLNATMVTGTQYIIKAKIKVEEADGSKQIGFWLVDEPNSKTSYQAAITPTTEFVEYTWYFTPADPSVSGNNNLNPTRIIFNTGKFGGKVYIDDVSCKASETELIDNGDFNLPDVSNWDRNYQGPLYTIDSDSPNVDFVLVYNNGIAGDVDYAKQAICNLNATMVTGTQYVIKAKIKVEEAGGSKQIGFWLVDEPNSKTSYQAAITPTAEFVEYTWYFTPADPSVSGNNNLNPTRIIFNTGKFGGKVYIDDVSCKASETELIDNGNFNLLDISNWTNNYQGPTYTRWDYEETISVSDAGFTTFSHKKNFSVDGDAVKAYKAKYEGGKVVLTSVTEIPAGQGVIIEAAEGPHTVSAINSASALDGNELLVSNGSVTGDGLTIYALGKPADKVGFVKVGNGVTIPAGKAYLYLETPPSARDFIGFDDETTAIKQVESSKMNVEGYFNLAGQRVAQPTKGLYIVNGKKVIIK